MHFFVTSSVGRIRSNGVTSMFTPTLTGTNGSTFSSVPLTLKVTWPNGNPGGKYLVGMTIWKEEGKGLTNRNRNLQFIYTLAIGVVLLLSSSRAFATNDENHI